MVVTLTMTMALVAPFAYAAEKYAVLFSGGWDTANNAPRYSNDTMQMYDVLTDIYGFSESNIYVYQSDGQNAANDSYKYVNSTKTNRSSSWDLDGDGGADIQSGAATFTNLSSRLTTLKSTMTSNDLLYFWVSDHGTTYSQGGGKQGSKIYDWGSSFTDASLASALNGMPGKGVYVFGQCYAGGFVDDLTGTNRLIVTATGYDLSWGSENSVNTGWYTQDSYLTVGNWIDGETFLDPWAYGLAGAADANDDGVVTMEEAFDYAEYYDLGHYQENIPQGKFAENPQWDDPSSMGSYLSLNSWLLPNEGGTPEPATIAGVAALIVMGIRRIRKGVRG